MTGSTATLTETPLPKPEGLEGVVAASTALSHVFGEEGKLVYRGYDIHELAGNATFEEVAYLLWNGRLPNQIGAGRVGGQAGPKRELSEEASKFCGSCRRCATDGCLAHRRVVARSLLPGDVYRYPGPRPGYALVGALPVGAGRVLPVAAGQGADCAESRAQYCPELSLPALRREPEERHWKPLEVYLTLLADHGMNASTFTARVIASTQSDLVSSLTGAVGALKGPLHGGAPSKVLDMLNAIGTAENVDPWLTAALDRGDRLMGFGHRVYKAEDPRAEILRGMAREASTPEFFELSRRTEERALEMLHERKPDRRLYTNVEFYSAAVLSAVGLPGDMFTPTFAVSRVVGWSAHVLEQVSNNRLIRPQSAFIGPLDKKYVPVEER